MLFPHKLTLCFICLMQLWWTGVPWVNVTHFQLGSICFLLRPAWWHNVYAVNIQSINHSINLYRAIVQRHVLQCSYAESKRNVLRRILNVLTNGAVRQFSGREFQKSLLHCFSKVLTCRYGGAVSWGQVHCQKASFKFLYLEIVYADAGNTAIHFYLSIKILHWRDEYECFMIFCTDSMLVKNPLLCTFIILCKWIIFDFCFSGSSKLIFSFWFIMCSILYQV